MISNCMPVWNRKIIFSKLRVRSHTTWSSNDSSWLRVRSLTTWSSNESTFENLKHVFWIDRSDSGKKDPLFWASFCLILNLIDVSVVAREVLIATIELLYSYAIVAIKHSLATTETSISFKIRQKEAQNKGSFLPESLISRRKTCFKFWDIESLYVQVAQSGHYDPTG